MDIIIAYKSSHYINLYGQLYRVTTVPMFGLSFQHLVHASSEGSG